MRAGFTGESNPRRVGPQSEDRVALPSPAGRRRRSPRRPGGDRAGPPGRRRRNPARGHDPSRAARRRGGPAGADRALPSHAARRRCRAGRFSSSTPRRGPEATAPRRAASPFPGPLRDALHARLRRPLAGPGAAADAGRGGAGDRRNRREHDPDGGRCPARRGSQRRFGRGPDRSAPAPRRALTTGAARTIRRAGRSLPRRSSSIAAAVSSASGRKSRRSAAIDARLAWTDTLSAAVTAPEALVQRHRERAQPLLELLIGRRVALPAHPREDRAADASLSFTVRAVSGVISILASRSSSSSSGRPARSTRPIDVTNAGSRVPTASVMLMIRRVGTRAT